MHGPDAASMRRFHHQHAKMRVFVEKTFVRLKGRWHVLRTMNVHTPLAARAQELSVVLHTFLEKRDAAYNE